MKLSHQTVLITGGSSGIGLELAKQLAARQNTVLICGRSAQRLSDAKVVVPEAQTFQCDISSASERTKLLQWVKKYHPSCNVLVNNAAIVHKLSFYEDEGIVEAAIREIDTNLVAPIALTKAFLNLFKQQKNSAVINITTGLIYAPRAVYPIYNATKAAVHAFTQVLRHQIRELPVEIIEVMMPVVDTPWHKGEAPRIAITPAKAVYEMTIKLEKGRKEIRVGRTKLLYALFRISPSLAFRTMNRLV